MAHFSCDSKDAFKKGLSCGTMERGFERIRLISTDFLSGGRALKLEGLRKNLRFELL